MKKALFLFILSLIMIGCSNEEPFQIIENSESQQNIYKASRKWGEENLGVDTAAFKAIAQKLVMSNMPLSVCNDVHQVVQNTIEAGVGEACYIKELISDNPKMWIPESSQTINFFKDILKFSFSGQSTDSIYITSDILDKVQIYWPYSENWDGVTMPLITWYGERFNSTTNFAYVYSNGQLRRIHVDDEYAQEHPVWIINYARYPHSCFPTLIIEESYSGARDSILEDDDEDDDPKPKVLQDFNIQVNNMIIKFQKRVPIDISGNTGVGGNRPNYITDESEIDPTKSYRISTRLIGVPQNFSYNFDEGNLYVTFHVAHYRSRTIYHSVIQYTLSRNYSRNLENLNEIWPKVLIESWDPKALDIALLITVGCGAEDTNSSYIGILRYDAEISLNRMLTNWFHINYIDTDNILIQKKYAWEEFFPNDIIKGIKSSDNYSWIYFFEEI